MKIELSADELFLLMCAARDGCSYNFSPPPPGFWTEVRRRQCWAIVGRLNDAMLDELSRKGDG